MYVEKILKQLGFGRRRNNAKRKAGRTRRLIANDREFNRKFNYANNYVKTAKYTFLTFLPVNLFEQFKRLANFYFLCLTIIQFIPSISTLQPYTTLLPLVVVLAVSAIKDAYDDIQRHRSDWVVNNRIAVVVRNGKIIQEKWRHVQVGDVIRMESGNFVAADILLLSTSDHQDGMCYVDTAELDGETNLKAKQALSATASMGGDSEALGAFDGEIVLAPPTKLLPPVPSAFEGRLIWRETKYALDNEKMLLRGCVIRNTKWCYGVVVFAGRDTKLMINSGEARFKRTSLDGFINVLIIGIMLFLVCMCLICSALCATWEYVYHAPTNVLNLDYVPIDRVIAEERRLSIFVGSTLVFFSYVILLNTVVPISLYVSVEVIRLFHSLFINWDCEMRCEKTGTSAMARTTTLSEELGQIQYVFSDKTGTLTENIMTFKKCSINGRVYGQTTAMEQQQQTNTNESSSPPTMMPIDLKSRNKWAEDKFVWYDEDLWTASRRTDPPTANVVVVGTFWRLLALCHTVMPEWKEEDDVLEYQAQSPDEAALVSAARNFGFVFKSRNSNSITIRVLKNQQSNDDREHEKTEEEEEEEEEIYELLAILDFDNVRKRMSVLVRRKNAGSTTITLFCKGADTVVLPRLARTRANETLKAVTQTHLDAFAGEGLRTLCLAYRTFNQPGQEEHQFCSEWLRKQRQASMNVDGQRDQLLAELYEEMERDMTLLGATAIEDKLQEGVAETVERLAEAKIKIWVLTGDKQETAVNIGYSSRLLTQEMRNVFVINSQEYDVVQTGLQEARYELKQCKDALRPRRVPSAAADDAEQGATGKRGSLSGGGSIFYYDGFLSDLRPDGGNALVIDGHSLVHALDPKLDSLFLKVARQCQAVICCRVTPSQKASVVELVMKNEKAITLAVGDGANDVPMIRCAHIGVGINGQEGCQAVLASDFSIAQFRFLQRLLLVHGRWSYFRMAKFMQYFFYKNIAFTLAQFWFAFFSGYSAQTLYDSFFISAYNTLFTSLPVLAVGVLEQDVDDGCSLQHPLLYTAGPANQFFNMRTFGLSLMHGVLSSMALFFVTYMATYQSVDRDGRSVGDLDSFGFTIISALVFSMNGQIALDTAQWTYVNVAAIFLSIASFYAFSLVYYEVFPYVSWILQSGYGSAFATMKTISYWATILLVCAVTLLPVVALRYLFRTVRPSLMYKIRAKHLVERSRNKVNMDVVSRAVSRADSFVSVDLSAASAAASENAAAAAGAASTGDPSLGLAPPTVVQRHRRAHHRHQPSTWSMPATSPRIAGGGSRVRTESIRSGYAFSHEYGFGERIMDVVPTANNDQRGGGARASATDLVSRRKFNFDVAAGTGDDDGEGQ